MALKQMQESSLKCICCKTEILFYAENIKVIDMAHDGAKSDQRVWRVLVTLENAFPEKNTRGEAE